MKKLEEFSMENWIGFENKISYVLEECSLAIGNCCLTENITLSHGNEIFELINNGVFIILLRIDYKICVCM